MINLDEFKNQISNLLIECEEGSEDYLETFVLLKKIEDFIKKASIEIKPRAVDLANFLYGKEKTFELNGAKVTQKKQAGKWDFSNIQEVVELEEKLKNLKSFYKKASKNKSVGLESVNSNTGEIISLPKYTEGSQTLSIEIKNGED